MSKKRKRVEHVYRDFTPEEDAMFQRARLEDEADLEALKAEARADFARLDKIEGVIRALKKTRQEKGLSLGDIDERTGMGKGNLSRLENDPRANPTLETLLRLAEAIGVELRIAIVDKNDKKNIDTNAA